MKGQQSYGVLQMHQRLLSERSQAEQGRKKNTLINRGIRRGKAICIAVGVLLTADSSSFAVPFRYDFGPETGTVVGSGDPIAEGITFSGLSLYGVSKGESFLYPRGPQPVETEEYTAFSGWTRGSSVNLQFDPLNPHVTFTVLAPTGYELLASSLSFTVFPGSGIARFLYTDSSPDYAVSQEVSTQVDIFTIPGTGGSTTVPIGYLSGSLSLRALAVPEEASAAGLLAISLAALILVSLLRRSRGGGPLGVLR